MSETIEMPIKSLTVKYVLILIVILVLLTAAMDFVMSSYFAEQYSLGFVSIPLFFLIIGALILTLVSKSVSDAKRYAKMYLLSRTIKILSFLVFLIVGAFCISAGKVQFIVASLVFALVFMVYETVVLLKLNKKVHEIQQNNQK